MKQDVNKPDELFISYSRRDQEYVSKLASDLNQKVAGVWYDQSDLAVGQKWRSQIHSGIEHCKVFVLVLSPDSAVSPNVEEEISKALSLQKIIIPILYRPVKLTGKLADLVHETQYLDLSLGSYEDNFHKLVDGLIAAGVAKQGTEKPFLFQPVKTDWEAVFFKIPGWGCAWSLGWLLFWFLIIAVLALINVAFGLYSSQGDATSIANITLGGGFGGMAGGLLAGLMTMFALRRYAPSVTWKHMAPAIPIWLVSGPLGVILSIIMSAFLLSVGALAVELPEIDCGGLPVAECLQQVSNLSRGSSVGIVLILILLIFLFALGVWFFVGLFAGWLAVRHLRRLEPGIQRYETSLVVIGWGFGALLGAVSSMILIVLATLLLGL